MMQMMKASSESVLTLVADGSQIGGTKPTSTASVVERARVSARASCSPGETLCTTRCKIKSRARRGLQKGFCVRAAVR